MRTIGMNAGKKENPKADPAGLKKENKRLASEVEKLKKEKEGLMARVAELEKEAEKSDPAEDGSE